jgi:hypothetical protein
MENVTCCCKTNVVDYKMTFATASKTMNETKVQVTGFTIYRGVDKFFKALAKLASSSEFSLAKSEKKNGQKYRKDK